MREINGIRSKIGSHSFSCVRPLGQPHSARSNENSPKPFQRKVQRQRALVLKSMTWLRNTGETPNTDSHFPIWLGPDSPMTTPTSAELEIHYSRSGAIRQRSHRLFRFLDKAKQSAKHLRIAVGFWPPRPGPGIVCKLGRGSGGEAFVPAAVTQPRS